MSDPTPVPIQFGTQLAGDAVTGPLTQELAENSFLAPVAAGAKATFQLRRTSGLTSFVRPGATAPVRGVQELDGYVFAVVGDRLYRVSQGSVVDDEGAVAGVGPVRFAARGANSDYAWLATASTAYAFKHGSLLALPQGRFAGVDQQDGYMLGAERLSNRLWRSVLDDPTTISALGFTTVDSYGDDVVGLVSHGREPLVFKQRSTEAFFNDGSPAVFRRTQVIERGCAAGDSIAKAEGSIFFLGDDRQVYRLQGYQPVPVSTDVVTRLIAREASPQTAVGWAYQEDGHTFYVLSFVGLTVAYDLQTGLWHRRVSSGMDRWRVSCHTYAPSWRKHVVGDVVSGDLYLLDPAASDEAGAVQRYRAAAPPLWNNGRRFTVDELLVDLETGTSAVLSGQGADPQVVLHWSTDGGATYRGGLARPLGRAGQRGLQVRWSNLGAHTSWTPRITVEEPVPVRVNGAYARVTRLAA